MPADVTISVFTLFISMLYMKFCKIFIYIRIVIDSENSEIWPECSEIRVIVNVLSTIFDENK